MLTRFVRALWILCVLAVLATPAAAEQRTAAGVDSQRTFDAYRPVDQLPATEKMPSAPFPEDSDGVYRSVIRAKAPDTLRGLLPRQRNPTWACSAPARLPKRSCFACSGIRSKKPAPTRR